MYIKKQDLIDLRTHLLNVTSDGFTPQWKAVGLCNSIADDLHRQQKEIMRLAVMGWEYHSGDKTYPITLPDTSPREAYIYCSNMWIGEYGRRRIGLASRMLAIVESHLDKRGWLQPLVDKE